MSNTTTEMDSLHTLYREEFDEIPKSVKCHLTIIKWIGVILILSTCAVPGIVIVGTAGCSNPTTNYISPIEILPDINQTACAYVKQYPLRYGTYATVCNMDGQIFVDLRRFVNGSATKIGIQLELVQWRRLKQMLPRIDDGLSEATTYWKILKSL